MSHKQLRSRQTPWAPQRQVQTSTKFPFSQGAAFRKYNSTIGIIGFRPRAPFIIGEIDNLDALNI
jgi:hypothetical protein